MKKLLIVTSLLLVYTTVNGQTKKFIATMEKNISTLDTSRTAEQLQALANNFERIASAEKAEWLPCYYAAYCYVNMTYTAKGDKIDTFCDKADTFINKADSLNPKNSEIFTLKSQIMGARISVNPMSRGQKYGTLSGELNDKAKELDPTNPRPYYLEGTSLFYTPSMFGGGKDKAKVAFEKSLKLFEIFKPATTINPHWGQSNAQYFLKQCDEK